MVNIGRLLQGKFLRNKKCKNSEYYKQVHFITFLGVKSVRIIHKNMFCLKIYMKDFWQWSVDLRVRFGFRGKDLLISGQFTKCCMKNGHMQIVQLQIRLHKFARLILCWTVCICPKAFFHMTLFPSLKPLILTSILLKLTNR